MDTILNTEVEHLCYVARINLLTSVLWIFLEFLLQLAPCVVKGFEEILLAALITEADNVLEDATLCEREVKILDELDGLIVVSLLVCTAYLR